MYHKLKDTMARYEQLQQQGGSSSGSSGAGASSESSSTGSTQRPSSSSSRSSTSSSSHLPHSAAAHAASSSSSSSRAAGAPRAAAASVGWTAEGALCGRKLLLDFDKAGIWLPDRGQRARLQQLINLRHHFPAAFNMGLVGGCCYWGGCCCWLGSADVDRHQAALLVHAA